MADGYCWKITHWVEGSWLWFRESGWSFPGRVEAGPFPRSASFFYCCSANLVERRYSGAWRSYPSPRSWSCCRIEAPRYKQFLKRPSTPIVLSRTAQASAPCSGLQCPTYSGRRQSGDGDLVREKMSHFYIPAGTWLGMLSICRWFAKPDYLDLLPCCGYLVYCSGVALVT